MQDKKWQEEFNDLCIKYKMEPIVDGSDYLIVVPKIPSQDIQNRLRAIVPQEIQYRYLESAKLSTTLSLKVLFHQIGGVTASAEMKGHTMIFKIDGESPALTDEESPVLNAIKTILNADAFIENWKIILNGTTIYDSKLNKMLAMQVRPERDICPTKDDILNLRITLETCQDVEEFINSI
jgi:hypothetical protein